MVPATGETSSRRRKQRKALSCTECARRKLRCSKVIPCTACLDRGEANSCRRRPIDGTEFSSTTSTPRGGHSSQISNQSTALKAPVTSAQTFTIDPARDESPGNALSRVSPAVHSSPIQDAPDLDRPIDRIAVDTPVTLEFFTLNRRRVPRSTRINQSALEPTGDQPSTAADPMLIMEQIDVLLAYHESSLTWTHNVVHLPTFKSQCSEFLTLGRVPELAWTALYYAMLSITLYHASPAVLQQAKLSEDDNMAIITYRKVLDALHEADFTANHSLSAVQAICLLIYVGYNIGESDRLSVLLASATRIAQCLGMHRLGADSRDQFEGLEHEQVVHAIVDREVRKRAWWFLIRQDWLQIPFANTYTVHPSQFNTPMPSNCFDDHESIIIDNHIRVTAKDEYTHGSYTTVLNHVSVLIWKTQDRMCKIGDPHDTRDGLRKLYDVVLQADGELKKLVRELPIFFRSETGSNDRSQIPAHVQFQSRALLLTLAHKFYSIHRHFQVLSFRDYWFAYSRISCVSIAVRSLRGLFDLSDEEHTYVVRNLWTVNTQVVTAAIWIVFELLFSQEGEESTWNGGELRCVVESCIVFLENAQHKSRIARNGIRLLRMLLNADDRLDAGQRARVDMEEIISCIRQNAAQEDSTQSESFTPLDTLMIDDWLPAWDIIADSNDVQFSWFAESD